MSGVRYTEEFKIAAVKQITEHGYRRSDVARRLGTTAKSLHDWEKKYGDANPDNQTIRDQQLELKRIKAELRRVTEERNILKEAAAFFAGESKKNTRS
jgi:transposase